MLQVVKWKIIFFQRNINFVLISLFVGRQFYAVKLSPLRRRDTIEYIITLSGLANYYKSMGHWVCVMEETRQGPNIQRNYSVQIKSFINYKVCMYSCTPSSTVLKNTLPRLQETSDFVLRRTMLALSYFWNIMFPVAPLHVVMFLYHLRFAACLGKIMSHYFR